MRRAAAPVVFALAIVLAGAHPAGAARPSATPPGEPFEAVFPFPGACGSFGLVATVWGRTHVITFADGSGISGGQFFITWSRDDDPTVSATFAISGPTFFDTTGAIDHGVGSWAVPLEDRSWVMVHGYLTLSDVIIDEFQALDHYIGTSTNVCGLLG
jgi:hypothetical protein